MATTSPIPWESLDRHNSSMFFAAALIFAVTISFQLLTALTSVGIPELIRDLTLAAAAILALIGLLGLAPQLKRRHPRVAQVGSAFAGLGIIGLLGIAIGEPILSSETPPAWFMPIVLLYFFGVPLSFLVFGSGIAHSQTPSRQIGAILLVIFVAFLFFLHIIPLDVGRALAQIPSLVICSGLLATGYLRYTHRPHDDGVEVSGEPATR